MRDALVSIYLIFNLVWFGHISTQARKMKNDIEVDSSTTNTSSIDCSVK